MSGNMQSFAGCRARWFAGLALLVLLLAGAVPARADLEDGTSEGFLPPRYARKFALHEPLYFSLGWRGGTTARFQLSFRYRFLGADDPADRGDLLAGHLWFGYTQTSLWDISAQSSPFRDTSYRPSLFWLKRDIGARWLGFRRVGLAVGLEHESNGRDGELSRSLNVFFVRPILVLGRTGGYTWTFSPKLYTYLGDLSDNPDIADYRGYADLLLEVEKPDSWGVSLLARRGRRRHYGSLQLDASYPLDRLFHGRVDSYVHFQVFWGWGESLLDYDRKGPTQVRVGLMLVR